MRYIRSLILFFLILSLYSCGTLKEGFTNQKKENKDEFLVEKKSPLVMPPDYNELPVPNSEISQGEINESGLKKLIDNNNDDSVISSDPNIPDKKMEELLIEKIKNN